MSCFKCGAKTDKDQRLCVSCRIGRRNVRKLPPALSFQENRVLGFVAQGLLNKEIAFEMGLTEGTIKEYVWRIFEKTGIHNRVLIAKKWWNEHEKVNIFLGHGPQGPNSGDRSDSSGTSPAGQDGGDNSHDSVHCHR